MFRVELELRFWGLWQLVAGLVCVQFCEFLVF